MQEVYYLNYYYDAVGVNVNLATNEASGGEAEGDTISNFENVAGGSGNDTIVGNESDNTILGYNGDDSIEGGKGNDSIFGGAGVDNAIFTGNRADYDITYDSASKKYTISDKVADRDGTDYLVDVESIQFADGVYSLVDDGTTAKPTVDIVDSSDTGSSNTDNITSDTTPTLMGTAEAGATISVKDKDGNVVGTTTADKDGNYSVTTSALADGTQDLSIEAKDLAGNTATSTQTITVDTKAPSAPTVTTNNADGLTGTAEAGSIVTVTKADGSTVTTVADASGNYSFNENPLGEGEVGKVTATDGAGNKSPEAEVTGGDQMDGISKVGTEDYRVIEKETQDATNTNDSENYESPAKIVALKDGGWVAVWSDADSLGDGGTSRVVKARYFNEDGTPKTEDIQLSTIAVDGSDGYDVEQFSVIELSGGNVAVTWLSENAMLSDTPIAVVLDKDGNKVSAEDHIIIEKETQDATNTKDSEDWESPAQIVALKDGGWIAIWSEYGLSDTASAVMKARYFNADGTARSEDIQLSDVGIDGTDGFDVEMFKAVELTDGNVVITWLSQDATLSATPIAVVLDKDGNKVNAGDYLIIEKETSDDADKNDGENYESPAQIVALKDGGWVAVWSEYGYSDTNSAVMKARYFDENGTAKSGDIQLANLPIDGTDGFDVEMFNVIELANGNTVVTWLSQDATLSATPVAVILDKNGNKINAGDYIIIEKETQDATNTKDSEDYESPAKIVALKDGGWVAVWSEYGLSDTTSATMKARAFNADGTPRGNDFDISTIAVDGTDGFDVDNFDLAVLENGNVVVTWLSQDASLSATPIYVTLNVADIKDTMTQIPTADIANASDSGSSMIDNITSDTTPTITGTAEAGATITIKLADGTVIGTTTVDSDGNYSVTTDVMVDGVYTLTIEAKDTLGNVATSTQDITIDTQTAKPTVDIVDSSDTGSSNTDNITSDTTPTLMGTAEAGATISVKDKDGNVVGTTTADKDGNYSVTTSALADGEQTLTIEAKDLAGNISEKATQNITIEVAEGSNQNYGLDGQGILGSDDADDITGSDGADLISTMNANDIIHSGAGDDWVWSENGEDKIYAGEGNDSVYGQNEIDTIYGEAGNDRLSAGEADDTVYGGLDNDEIWGGYGADTLYGDEGNDIIVGETESDKLYGGDGDDTLNGNAGTDLLDGGAGNDTLIVDEDRSDTLTGGTGVDRFTFKSYSAETDGGVEATIKDFTTNGDNIFDADEDIIDLSTIIQGDVTMDNYTQFVRITGSDTSTRLEVDRDGTGANWDSVATISNGSITTSNLGNMFESGQLLLNGINDIHGTNNAETMDTYTAGDDVSFGYNGNDVISTGEGNDKVYAGNENDKVYGGDGNDTLFGEYGDDTINGEAGVDNLYGGFGNDTLDGGSENDQLSGSWGDDTLTGGTGNDLIEGGRATDNIKGGDGDDILVGDTLWNDHDYAEDGNDTIDGGAGNDIIMGQYGADNLTGGDGSDTFVYQPNEWPELSGVKDIIYDFTSDFDGVFETNEDIIDLHAEIIGEVTKDNLSSFVRISDTDVIQILADGGLDSSNETNYNWISIADTNGAVTTQEQLTSMFDAGQLILNQPVI